MKRSILVLILALAAAGLCPAQSESAAPAADTTRARVKVEQTTDDSTTVTVTTEKGATDSTTTIVIHDGRNRQSHRSRSRLHRDWILGCTMNNLALQSFPGAVFLQRSIGRRWFAGLEVGCDYDHQGPFKSYLYGDSEINQEEHLSWAVQCYPELTRYLGFRSWLATVAVRGQVVYSYEQRTITQILSTVTHYKSLSKRESWTCGLIIPVGIERRFKIGGMMFSAGLRTNILSLSTGRYTTRVKTYSYFMGDMPETHTDCKIPLTLSADGPFSNSASIQLKYWF